METNLQGCAGSPAQEFPSSAITGLIQVLLRET
jgi:hypothetical protein